MNTIIRQETKEDYSIVFELIEKAFREAEFTDKTEHYLVERLRTSKAFIPELSLVAEHNNQIVGHILLTKIKIKNKANSFESLALAPVSVLPEFQRKGIGGKLINEGHNVARKLGYTSVVLLGHQAYYPRFGYQRVDTFGIELPFDAPKENCMAMELVKDGLSSVSGMVEYSAAFKI